MSVSASTSNLVALARSAITGIEIVEPAALVGFPYHRNIGDSAIWLGERAALRDAGVSISYASHRGDHSDTELRRRIGRYGTILLHGGGNLGDLWPDSNRFRLHVLRTFRDHPIVQLPQTIRFHDPANQEGTFAVVRGHPRLRVLVRDDESLQLMAAHAPDVPVDLVPDAALALGSLRRIAPTTPILWLARTDHESLHPAPPAPDLLRVADWRDSTSPAMRRIYRQLAVRMLKRGPHRGRKARLPALRLPAFDALARGRVKDGVRLVSSARVVVTDRLHGHILCLLLGIPHVLLSDAYGKVSGFRRTWGTVEVPLADDSSTALALAQEMAARNGAGD